MDNTETGSDAQRGQIPLSGPGFMGRAAYHDKRARDPTDAFRLYYFADRAPVKGAAKAVLWALAHRCDYRTGETRYRLSVGGIADRAGLSPRGVRYGLRRLQAAGYVEVIESEHPGSREEGAHHYRIVTAPPLRAV